ncbi:hypothetical protein Bbelb_129150 [Branchiostoma belcheri]|nr:hypothetical protein Bbelb_129150 [Branchiostoma belcheri]
MKVAVLFVVVLFAGVWDESSACNSSGGSHSGSSSGSNNPRPRPGWPTFSQLRSNYPRYYSIDWDGLVAQEGLSSWLYGVVDKNTCAMRVSRALTYAGRQIAPGSCNWSGVRDSQDRPYIIRVATMRCYLENQYGAADVTGSSESSFRGKDGIIVFQNCGFQAATGHVDLWDGYSCVGQCPGYFNACSDIRLFEF